MSLSIFEYDKDNNQYLEISQDGMQSRPIQTTHNGTNGETVEKQLFLKNNNADFYYTDIRLTPVPATKVRLGDVNYPEAYIGYKVIVKDAQPSRSEWASTQSGDVAIITNVGTTNLGDTSYKPLWIQVTIPPGARIGALRDVSIQLTAEENPIGG
jgi:hypothetical protein